MLTQGRTPSFIIRVKFSLLRKYNKRYSCTSITLFYISGPGLKQLEYSDLSFVPYFPVTVFVYLQDHPNAQRR